MKNNWFKKLKSSNDPQIRLFCFPHAGGSAETLKHWEKFLPEWMELYVLQLPGRGNRFSEELITSMELLIDSVTTNILPLLDVPYVFLGHSLGGSVAFELTRRIRKLNYNMPSHLFIIGREGPKIPPDLPKHELPDAEMVKCLKLLAGTDSAIFENEDLLNLFLPMIRADLKLAETYFEYYREEEPLSCHIHAFWGTDELELNDNKVNEWRKETSGIFTVDKFDGHHFFLHDNPGIVVEKMLKYINN